MKSHENESEITPENLVQTVFDACANPIAYHKAVRDERGKIIDFRFQLENQEARKYTAGDRTGQLYSEVYPGIKETVVFKEYCEVVETGNRLDTEIQLTLKGIDRWFHLAAAKLSDGLVATAVDVTERKRSEQEIYRTSAAVERGKVQKALSESEEKYRTLFNSIDEGFSIIELIFDDKGKVIDYWHREDNPAFEKITGIKNATGKKMSELLSHLESAWHEMIEHIYYTGEPRRIEYPVQELGQWYDVYMSRFGPEGSPLIACVYSDLTHRKRHEQRQAYLLKLSDALRPLSDATEIEGTACRLLGEELKAGRVFYSEISEANNYVKIKQDYLGGNSPSLVGSHPLSAYSWVIPHYYKGKPIVIDDVYQSDWIPKSDLPAMESTQVISYCLIPLIKNNILVGTLTASEPFPRKWKEHEVSLLEETAERVWAATERAKAEEALRQSESNLSALFAAMPVGVSLMDKNGKSIVSTAEMARFLPNGEIPSLDKERSLRWKAYYPNGDPVEVENFPGKRAMRGENVGPIEFLYQTDDGKEIWTRVNYLPIEDEDGKVARLVCVVTDIDELKRNSEALLAKEEKLRELNARLLETDKAKTVFFNNVSHEFRTPLTLLIGPLEELMKSGKSKMTSDDMQKLQFAFRNAVRLQKLVTTLLDFARIEAGKLEAFYQPTEFSKVTTELAASFRSAIEKAGLKYVVKAEQISEPVYLNREMWEKIVFNLLSNAFKFTQKGKIEVIIREKKKHAELKVKDSGIGIAPKNIDRIFDRFTRIEGVPSRTQEGTGIGLALVRELVTAHGGSIKVKSTEGAGSEFIISIPKGKAHFAKHQIFENRDRQQVQDLKKAFVEETLGWLPEDVKATRRNMKQFQKEGVSRVIVVEDNADMREYLSTVLAEDDHKIVGMEDGAKVLKFLEEGGQADLILSDVMMPVMNGFELIRNLKATEKFSHIPVILLTAKVTEEAKIEGLRVGADAYLTKPFSARELRAIVLATIKRVQKNIDQN